MVWTLTQGKYYYHNVNDSCTNLDKPAITYDDVNDITDSGAQRVLPSRCHCPWELLQCMFSVPVNAMLHDKYIQLSLYGIHKKFKFRKSLERSL